MLSGVEAWVALAFLTGLCFSLSAGVFLSFPFLRRDTPAPQQYKLSEQDNVSTASVAAKYFSVEAKSV